MEQITTEEQLRNELEISDFKDITQDNIIPLASNVSRTDRNVLESAFSQIINFKEIVSSAFSLYGSITKEQIKANNCNETEIYIQIKNEQNCCFELLKSDQLTFDEKLEILKHLNNIREWISDFDKESKKYKIKIQHDIEKKVLTLLGLCVASIGIKIYIDSTDNNQSDIENKDGNNHHE